jgi:ATP-dependent DNA helicase RecQ
MDKLTILKKIFGYSSFRPGQEEVIDAILAGKDALAVMPTGAGKSLCYQIPALLLDGMTIVISPLISLMKDQVTALKEAGCGAAFLNSSLSGREYAETMNQIENGKIKLLYIAPERLQRTDVSDFANHGGIPLVVVDEAHCVSHWGHDFRTSYLQIAGFIKSINPRPVVAAFTATATVNVRDDIRKMLALRGNFSVNTGFDRPNLYFEVQKPKDKKTALLECLNRYRKASGIIYCATRKTVDDTCHFLLSRGFNAARYHAGLDDEERKETQDDFINDRKTIMVATNAFGMGIDKSNVSFVIHYNMPKNIESYYQEAGRAGRDGSPADCVLLYNGQDVRINQYLITHDEDGETDDALQAHNLELLKQMTFYAASRDCLRRRLLAYFGEHYPANCGNCSNCLTEYKETDVTMEAQKIVSCVNCLKQRGRSFGKTMIIDILRGSKNEKVLRLGFETLSVFSVMSGISVQRIRLVLDHLIEEGFLFIEEGMYPVITLGSAQGLLREEIRILMKLPGEDDSSIKKAIEKSGDEKIQNQEQKNPSKVSPDKALLRQNGMKKPDAKNQSDNIDENLFDKLRKLRKEIAAKESVPAYVIFHDSSLRDMCRKKPVSLIQFSDVSGVGNLKLEKYGEIFTGLIREYCEK